MCRPLTISEPLSPVFYSCQGEMGTPEIGSRKEYPVNKICFKFCQGKENNVLRGNGRDLNKIGSVRECIWKKICLS